VAEPAGGGAPAPDPAEEALRLRERHARLAVYVREKVDELLKVIGTAPLRPEELDDDTLIALDPIGIVAGSFRQVLAHQKNINEQLRFAREELQAIFESAGLGILVIDREQRVLACNAKFREQFAVEGGDLTGRPCREAVCRRGPHELACPFKVTLETGEPYHCPDWVVGGRHYDVVETAVRNQAGEVTGSVLVYSDITERIAFEDALRHSEERYRDLFENTSDLILRARPDGSLEYVNAAWCTTLGYSVEEAARLSLLELLHPECDSGCRARFQALLRGEGGGRVRTAFLAKDGRTVVLEGDLSLILERGRTTGIRAILRDVTDREVLEEELRKREKLESVGLLAGGIAHDFNNILTAVLGNISLAQATIASGDPAAARLAEAEKAALTARSLTQQLLTFSQGGAPVKRLASIAQLVRDQTTFACRGSHVECQVRTDPDLWTVEVDEGQIGQAVNNLVLNAVQAMEGGGTVRVAAENVEVGPQDNPALARGRHVRITVQDTGCGIPRENLQRMFDPYFTTKPKGTGLGLAVTYSVVKQHGGHIAVDSEIGRGSTFTIHLPASGKTLPPAPAEIPSGRRGKGRILVMDDERIVRDTAGAMLELLGYESECAENGEAALALYEQARHRGQPFDAVIMDLTIPGGMGGKEAIQAFRAWDPAVRAVVSSGYSNDPVMANFSEYGFCGVITKPYRIGDLSAALDAALGRPADRR
jgi:PAS domain S-box-containing protein